MPKFKKYERVETVTPHKGVIQYGIVLSVAGGKVTVFFDNSTRVSGHESCFKHSVQPVPTFRTKSFKRKDRVELNFEGAVVCGFVKSSNLFLTTVTLDGGERNVTADTGTVRYSQAPVARDTISTPMDAYEVRGFRECGGRNGDGYVANIYKNGRKVCIAENEGRGGCDSYHSVDHAGVCTFEEDVMAWAKSFATEEPFEPGARWVFWYVFKRPFNVTAAAYWKEWEAETASAKA